jgi:hypothetical protein
VIKHHAGYATTSSERAVPEVDRPVARGRPEVLGDWSAVNEDDNRLRPGVGVRWPVAVQVALTPLLGLGHWKYERLKVRWSSHCGIVLDRGAAQEMPAPTSYLCGVR